MSDITIETTIDRWPAVRGRPKKSMNSYSFMSGGEHVGAVHVGRPVGERRWTSDEPAPLTGPLAGVDERGLASLTAWSLEALARRIVRACTWDLREAALREGHRRTDAADPARARRESALARPSASPAGTSSAGGDEQTEERSMTEQTREYTILDPLDPQDVWDGGAADALGEAGAAVLDAIRLGDLDADVRALLPAGWRWEPATGEEPQEAGLDVLGTLHAPETQPRLMDAEEEAALAETERSPSEPGPLDPVVGVLAEGREVLCETLADAETVQEAAELCGVPVRVRTSSEGWIVRASFAAAGASPAAEPTSRTEGLSDQQARAAWVECRECGTLVDPATVGGPLGDARYDAEQGGYLDSDRRRLCGAVGAWPCVGCRTRAAYRRALIETRGDSEAARLLVEADAARLSDLPRVPAWA